MSLTNSRSLAQVREALKSSRAGSSASTPQPATAAGRIAASKGSAQKKPFSLSDDDDDESESDSESGSEQDENDKKEEVIKEAARMVNGRGVGNVIVRQRTPSESGSDDSDDDEGSEL